MDARNDRRSSRRTAMVFVIALCLIAMGVAGCVIGRPDAQRWRLGIMGHYGGDAVDIANAMPYGSMTDTPVFWVATPFSVRGLVMNIPIFDPPGGIQEVEILTAQASNVSNKAIDALPEGLVCVTSSKALSVIGSNGPSLGITGQLGGLVAGNDVAILSNGLGVTGAVEEDPDYFAYAVIADGSAGMRVVDVLASTPKLKATVNPRSGGTAVAVAAADRPVSTFETGASAVTPARTFDTRVFLAESGRLYMYDIADPAAPRLLTSTSVPGIRSISTQQTPGGLLVYAVTDSALVILGVEDTMVTALGSTEIPGEPKQVSAYGDDVVVASGSMLVFADASDPTEPFVVDTADSVSGARGVAAFTGSVATAEGNDGTRLFEYPMVESMKTAEVAPVGVMPTLNNARDVALFDDAPIMYVAESDDGLASYYLEDGAYMVPIGTEPLPGVTTVDAYGPVAITGAGNTASLYWADIGPLPSFIVSAALPAPAVRVEGVGDPATEPPITFVADGAAGLQVLGWPAVGMVPAGSSWQDSVKASDVADSAAGFEVVAEFPTPSPAYSVAVDDRDVALAGCGDGYLRLADASDAMAPLDSSVKPQATLRLDALGKVALGGSVRGIEVRGDYAYAACETAGLKIVRISDPLRPVVVGTGLTASRAKDIRINEEGVAFLTCSTGVEAWKVTNPAKPVKVGHYRPANAERLELNFLGMPVVAGGNQGVTILSDLRHGPSVAKVENVDDGAAYFGPAYPHAYASVNESSPVGEYFSMGGGPFGSSVLAVSQYTSVNGGYGPPEIFATMDTPGSYNVQALAADIAGNSAYAEREFRIITDERISGPNHYALAATISQRYFQGSDTIVLATGRAFQDALVGGPLANTMGVPLLLTGNRLPAVTVDEIKRLGATRVIILGQKLAMPDSVVADLIAAGIPAANIERIGGARSEDTARLVALRIKKLRGTSPRRVFITNKMAWSDMMSVAGLAANQKSPILLVERDRIPPATADALRAMNAERTIIIGGTGSVSSALKFPGRVGRLAGANRYATAKAIADYMIALGYKPETTFLTTGNDYEDALCASQMTARSGSPLLLTGSLPVETKSFLTSRKRGIIHLKIVGSTAAVSSSTETAALLAIGLKTAPPPMGGPVNPNGSQLTGAARMSAAFADSPFADLGNDAPAWLKPGLEAARAAMEKASKQSW